MKIKSYCKINLFLKVIRKLRSGYHEIESLITYCNIFDLISISEISKNSDKIIFYGKFKNNINLKKNTITKTLKIIRRTKKLQNKNFKISIKKNIPHGSGLGGGSSNAASLLNYFNFYYNLKFSKQKLNNIAKEIGSDVPLCLIKKNSVIYGNNHKIARLKNNFNLFLLVVFPNISSFTKVVYSNNKKFSKSDKNLLKNFKKKKNLMNYLKLQSNDLQLAVTEKYPLLKRLINFISNQKGCYFSRITGSGSACVGVFLSLNYAKQAEKSVKKKFPDFWLKLSKTI